MKKIINILTEKPIFLYLISIFIIIPDILYFFNNLTVRIIINYLLIPTIMCLSIKLRNKSFIILLIYEFFISMFSYLNIAGFDIFTYFALPGIWHFTSAHMMNLSDYNLTNLFQPIIIAVIVTILSFALKNKKKAIAVVMAVSMAATAAVFIGNSIYNQKLRENVDIYISSVSVIENPDDPNNEEMYGLEPFFNMTAEELYVYHITDPELSETQKKTKMNLNQYNVFKIEFECNKANCAEDKYVYASINNTGNGIKYIQVPCNVSDNICNENYVYYFVSKEYSEEEIKQYLENNGTQIYTYIGLDELRPLATYEQTIFYKP